MSNAKGPRCAECSGGLRAENDFCVEGSVDGGRNSRTRLDAT